jgi:5-methylcytosine-specific restriction endonuclease McrA
METLAAPIPVSVAESLSVYGILPESLDLTAAFLRPVLTDYITSATTGPPVWASTRTEACEICERDWIPLSYHHLIPRDVHAKVLKRGWHEEWQLNSVAWLCRACHSFVHRMASNEELAREYYTVERILERDDVLDWARWVGRVRWKAK